MALEMNTIGVKIKYCVAASAGASRPTTGYTNIPDIKSIPEINLTPSQLEVTNLVDKNKRYIPGVQDPGSDFNMNANLTTTLKTLWGSLCASANAAWASGISTWFEVAIPNFDSFFFAGLPVELGLSAQAVDAVEEAALHIVPNQIAGWASAST